jgi:hypothetical protein
MAGQAAWVIRIATLVGHRKASGQGGARFDGLRIVRLAAFEHGSPH